MTVSSRLARLLLACGAIAAVAAPAAAGLLPVQVTVTPESGQYRWTYAIVLPTDSQIRSGDYFTIYDFAGLVPNSNTQPTDWSYSSQMSGPTPPDVLPSDNAALPNLTWTYTGPTITTGQQGMGNFWALSLFGDSTDSFFTASTHRTSDGKLDNNITSTTVPVPSATPSVPEPATLLLAGLGLPIVGLIRRRRKTA